MDKPSLLEKLAFTDIFCKTSKTHLRNSLQFPDEMNTSGGETPTTFIPIHTNCDYGADDLICKLIYFDICIT